MKLKDKKNILELLNSINEGISYLKKCSIEQRLFMLNECRDAFLYLSSKYQDEIEIQNKVEKILNNINVSIENYDNKVFENNINNIEIDIKNIIDLIINNIPTKLEIAFMPYKVSMWDSMESIWKEAIKDKDCICNVVPIPYYELDESGKAIRLCYEGDLFPKNINITNYKNYQLESIKPDIIYIHNPFDEYNRLTMIEPRYFSNNLNKCTDMLVYIPYFVAGSYKDEEEHKNTCYLPGPLSATKVIVQSQEQKNLYVSNGYDKNKVLNLGSPKFDAVLYAINNKEYLIEKQEKYNDKKVFLLSVGITNLLADDNWINELNEIIDVFLNKDNCNLICRFHPLTQITIDTMRPNLYDVFNKVKQKINNSKNVSLDENIDVYKSIAMSDALISDYSSVMFQYLATKKPVLAFIDDKLIKENRIFATDYLGAYFKTNTQDIINFRDMVLNNKDIKRNERMKRLENSITNLYGKCGQEVHKTIKNEVLTNLIKENK